MSDAWRGHEGLLALRERLHAWARDEPRVLGAVAFGSTERADRPADEWSDLDIALLVDDPAAWLGDLGWVDAIAPVWVRLVFPAPIPGFAVVQVLFAGGYDIDIIPFGRDQLATLRDPDVAPVVFGGGARVLVDREASLGWVSGVGNPPPPAAPTREAFDHVVAVFLHQTAWATKRLRRGELWRAHDDVDDFMRDRLLTMLEWHALARGVPGVAPESRRLERWLPADVAAELPGTFATFDARSIAVSLVRSLRLFGRIGREVAVRYGYAYPEDAHRALRAWLVERLAEAGLPTE